MSHFYARDMQKTIEELLEAVFSVWSDQRLCNENQQARLVPMKGKLRRSLSPEYLKVPDEVLHLNGRDIPFLNNVTYIGVAFDRRMTWRHHIERTAAKALRTHVRTHSLFRSRRLSTNIKLTLYKALFGQL
jgi:hypothetical protein